MKEKLGRLLQNEKIRKWLILLLLAGIALIFLSEFLPSPKNVEAPRMPEGDDTEIYVNRMEEKLTAMVSAMTGAEARVVLTVDVGYQSVLAQEGKEDLQEAEGKSSRSSENGFIIIKNADGSQSAVQILRKEPVIRGVVVLCKNGNRAEVQQAVLDAVTTVLHISSARVCVSEIN